MVLERRFSQQRLGKYFCDINSSYLYIKGPKEPLIQSISLESLPQKQHSKPEANLDLESERSKILL